MGIYRDRCILLAYNDVHEDGVSITYVGANSPDVVRMSPSRHNPRTQNVYHDVVVNGTLAAGCALDLAQVGTLSLSLSLSLSSPLRSPSTNSLSALWTWPS